LKSTVLEHAPIIPVSSVNGMGREALLEALDRVASTTSEKSADARPRLPIDRAFVLEGIGTVVTGTLVEGGISVGDTLELYPPKIQTKVRSIESHGEKCETIYAGQRTAINLSGVKKDDIRRGYVLAKPGSMHTTNILDCKLRLLKDVKRSFSNRARVRFHHGTGESIGRMVLLNDTEASGGDEIFVQVLLEEEIAVKTGDRFILRNYSPVTTIGGGIVIDAGPVKHKRFHGEVIEGLSKIESGEAFDLIEQAILSHSKDFEKISKVLLPIGLPDSEVANLTANMRENGIIFALSEDEDKVYMHRAFYEKLAQNAVELLSAHHKKAPLEAGMSKEEFRVRLTKKMGITADLAGIRTLLKSVEDRLMAEKLIDDAASCYKVHGFRVKVDNTQQQVADRLMKDFAIPATPFEVLKGYDKSMKADLVFRMLVNSGRLTKLSPETAQDSDALKRMIAQLREKADAAPEKNITLAEARDCLGISRKQALSILEYLDKNKVTKKIGDARIFV
ncbi:MAG: SelB C-terminal domain-containing protein, partial [Bacillota bacterium]|nr:SelB C-terminal domain-containing protein [Bacillota bacterium]